MPELIQFTPPANVSDEYKARAKEWLEWKSDTHPPGPGPPGTFVHDYTGGYTTEQVFVVEGQATVTPNNAKYGPVKLVPGCAVKFYSGLGPCTWHVTTPMTKFYNYFDKDDKLMGPSSRLRSATASKVKSCQLV